MAFPFAMRAMIFPKMAEALRVFRDNKVDGQVLVSATNELAIMFFKAPPMPVTQYLKRHGWKDGQMDGTYVYRP